MFDFGDESSEDDRAASSSYHESKKQKSAPMSNFYIRSRKRVSDDVVEISDSDSEVSECSDSDFEDRVKKRKPSAYNSFKRNDQTRSIFNFDELDAKTKEAKSAEKQSILQRKEKQTFLANVEQSESASIEIVLDVNSTKNKKIVIHNQLAKHLKPHQIDGIKHMYDCCYGRVDKCIQNPKNGSGCILAHCMGLGKTLQMIALLHTVINYPEFATNRILILSPKSTIPNWKHEIGEWIGSISKTRRLKVFEFSDSRAKDKQLDKLNIWSRYGQNNENAACFLMSYEAFRSLIFYGQQGNKKKAVKTKNLAKEAIVRDVVQRTLLEATDLIVCDEGHTIKSLKSITNQAVAKLQTKRRIVLTGTPMQNNLMEYHAMVNFVKPAFLGTEREFRNIYANPIKKGQHKDSTYEQIKLMRMQSFNLNRELESFVHRREVSFLMKLLPKKFEYVLYVPMSEKQAHLYQHYLNENPYMVNSKRLFADYASLKKIWTHPKQLEISFEKANKRDTRIVAEAAAKAKSFDFDEANDEPEDEAENNENLTTSMAHCWWRPFVTDEDLNTISQSPKFEVMFEILEECQKNSEKCLIFSTSTVCLDIVEIFLKKMGSWIPGRDYFRLDGSTKNFQRNKMICEFNRSQNKVVKAFLISSRAGGQGINLTAANRIILLDTSWNPAVDQQSIFRIFRFGQKKNCYIYRLLSMGTMEEKIYSRSVTKQAMSFRVVDKQQIDRHYNMAELDELYTFTKPELNEREIPIQPKDELLMHLLNKFPDKVYKYHEHESLLDNKHEEDMTDEEKREAMLLHEASKMKQKTSDTNLPGSSASSSLNYAVEQAFEQDSTASEQTGNVDDNVDIQNAAPAIGYRNFSSTSHINATQPKAKFDWLAKPSANAAPSGMNSNAVATSSYYGNVTQRNAYYSQFATSSSAYATPSGSHPNTLATSSYASQPRAQPVRPPTSFLGKRKGPELNADSTKQQKLTDPFGNDEVLRVLAQNDGYSLDYVVANKLKSI